MRLVYKVIKIFFSSSEIQVVAVAEASVINIVINSFNMLALLTNTADHFSRQKWSANTGTVSDSTSFGQRDHLSL